MWEWVEAGALRAGERLGSAGEVGVGGEGGKGRDVLVVARVEPREGRVAVAAGLVHRLETLNAYIACGHPHRLGGPAFAICEACHRVTEVEDGDLLAAVDHWADRSGFRVERLAIEMVGRCARCPAPPVEDGAR